MYSLVELENYVTFGLNKIWSIPLDGCKVLSKTGTPDVNDSYEDVKDRYEVLSTSCFELLSALHSVTNAYHTSFLDRK